MGATSGTGRAGTVGPEGRGGGRHPAFYRQSEVTREHGEDEGSIGNAQGVDAGGAVCKGGQKWKIWYNNAASALCNDPASCCQNREQLWTVDTAVGSKTTGNTAPGATMPTAIVNKLTMQCLSVHSGGMHNVGVTPCNASKSALQGWAWKPVASSTDAFPTVAKTGETVGRFVSSTTPPGKSETPHCLARTNDVQPGVTEVWAGPLSNGDTVVLLFNRNSSV